MAANIMRRKIVNTVKLVDNSSFGIIQWCRLRLQAALYWPEIYNVRKKIIASVGQQAFEKASKTSFVVVPDNLPPSAHIHRTEAVLAKIFFACKINPKSFDPSVQAQVLVNWHNVTTGSFDVGSYAVENGEQGADKVAYSHVINGNCTDISKQKLGSLNAEIFGYELDIDPTMYVGSIVEKSDENAKHDGRVVTGPLKQADIKDDCVYSVLVDNVHDGYGVDLRLIYMNGLLDFFYEKRRPVETRFARANSAVSMRKLSDEFSPDEIQNINKLCEQLGANFGELDVLRDRKSNKIYVVDFAKTPGGPPVKLSWADNRKAVEQMSVAFIKTFIQN